MFSRCCLVWPPLLLGALATAASAAAAGRERVSDKVIDIALGSSQTVRVPLALERIVVGDPQICEVVPLPSGQLLFSAKAAGETQVTAWSRDGSTLSYRVVASIPVLAMQAALRDAFPQEEELAVRATAGAVYLTGAVSDASVAEAAHRMVANLLLASGRKIEVINLTTVVAPQQVQLQLRFVEISRSSLRAMGFNGWYSSSTTAGALFGPNQPFHYSTSNDTQHFVGPSDPLRVTDSTVVQPSLSWLPIITSPINGAFALSFANTSWQPLSATLALLEQKGVSKTLSEPTLVAMSGQEARFLVGGEFPIPVPDTLGHILIQFKSFGAQMTFTPTVLGSDTVHIKVDATVSDIDKSNGITLASVSVPALKTRQSSTSLRLRDGQSFAMAGLLSDKITSQVAKTPLLGDIPVLGMLFRQVNYSRDETELVILASVHLVKAMDAAEVPNMMQDDEFTDPSDLELFLVGTGDLTRPPRPGIKKRPGSPEGAVGFSR